MLTFGLVSSKVCIIYSRCACNKLWRSLECLHHEPDYADPLPSRIGNPCIGFANNFLQTCKQCNATHSDVKVVK